MVFLFWIALGLVLGTLLPSGVQEWVKGKVFSVAEYARIAGNFRKQTDSLQPAFATASLENKGVGNDFLRSFFAGARNLASFLWRFKFVILTLVFFVLVVSWSRSCAPGGGVFGKSRDRLELENELAEAEIETKQIELQRNERIGEIARDHAVRRTQIRLESERGRDEIARATPDVETPIDAELVRAWRGYLDGLCLYPRADGSLAHSCGPGA